jgi:large subunit ribosomal protein L2
LSIGSNSSSGRNSSGSITVRHRNKGKKKLYYNVDYFRHFTNKIAICINIKKISYINCFISLIKYSNGIFSYILCSHGFKPGDYTYTSIRPPKFSLAYNSNCSVLLKYLDYNVIFFNLELQPGTGGKYARSAGSFCKLISINLEKNYAKVILPTGKIKIISIYCLVSLGRASNIFYKNQFFSKAGYNRNLGIRPSVRGVAMNPVDHPHGGRTKTNSPEVTP